MANIKIFSALITVLSIVFMSEAFGGKGAKFIIHEVHDLTPNDDWLTDRKMFVRNKQYTNVECRVLKTLPEETEVRTLISYRGMDLPEHQILLCDALEDKVFGDDFKECLFPMPGFPTECPIGPTDFIIRVEDYKIPQYKVPPNTPPGPVVVNVTIAYEDEIFVKLNAIGEVVQEFLG